MRAKNISRYTYKKTAFQGWRLALRRQGKQFVKYFADRQYEDCTAAFKAAVALRNAILKELKKGTDPAIVFESAQELLANHKQQS
ncbi:MAG: hypothetical protein IJB33_02785 [Akkermansia sp.]|nr:hypothetical protein [Akkermansia sp.]MBQ7023791.1 hypothetical protein [Akkermansia sp.]